MKKYITIIFFSTIFYSYSQDNCTFKPDYSKILSNKNLDKFVAILQENRLTVYDNKKEIPSFIKTQLDCLAKGFSIANKNQKYQSNCISSNDLPKRQLIYMAKNNNFLVITYLMGGFAVSNHILFVEFKNGKILDLWKGRSLQKLDSNSKILKYIKNNRIKKGGLNESVISF